MWVKMMETVEAKKEKTDRADKGSNDDLAAA